MKSRKWLRGAIGGALGLALTGAIMVGTESVSSAGILPLASVSIQSSVNPSADGQAVKFTSFVGILPPKITTSLIPTGSVTFFDAKTAISGPVPLNTGGCTAVIGGDVCSASITLSDLTPGTHAIYAVYSGNLLLAGGVSAVLDQVVKPPVSTPATTSVLNFDSATDCAVAPDGWTDTITSNGDGAPTGSVTLNFQVVGEPSNDHTAGPYPLVKTGPNTSAATSVVTITGDGQDIITAVYTGDGTRTGSTSNPVEITVTPSCG